MWNLPGPGLVPVSPALAGGFLITVPPGKPLTVCLKCHHSEWVHFCRNKFLWPFIKTRLLDIFRLFSEFCLLHAVFFMNNLVHIDFSWSSFSTLIIWVGISCLEFSLCSSLLSVPCSRQLGLPNSRGWCCNSARVCMGFSPCSKACKLPPDSKPG